MSNQREYHLHDGKKGAALAIRVTPRANKNEIVGVLHDGTVKIHLTTPASDGAVNDALLDFLSEILGITKSKLEIVAGEIGRDKLVSVLDMSVEEVHQIIVGKVNV